MDRVPGLFSKGSAAFRAFSRQGKELPMRPPLSMEIIHRGATWAFALSRTPTTIATKPHTSVRIPARSTTRQTRTLRAFSARTWRPTRSQTPGTRSARLGPSNGTIHTKSMNFTAGPLFETAAIGAPLMTQSLLGSLVVDFGIQFVGWVFASLLKTEKFYDLTGSLTFLSLSIGTLVYAGQYAPRQVLLTGMVALWAMRLGSFLVVRILRDGKDTRFEKAKQDPKTFAIFWGLQGVWVWVTLLPVLLVNSGTVHPALGALDIAATSLWAVGFLMEALADYQKFQFKNDPANEGKFIDQGLWKYSRHPNYCGEMLMWWAVFGAAAGSLQPSVGKLAAGAVSPVFVMGLLLFVSGVPLLEQAAEKKWGQDPEYQAYKKRTWSVLPKVV